MTSDALSPAERYAAFRRRQTGPVLAEFEAGYPFGLDAFQRTACTALEEGRGVLVAAPTGAGKTVVGEFAVHLALQSGRKCFYTTPIKALSNQKHADLRARYGEDRVGLLTGDTAINGDADVVVMTTEVLRNMLYAGSDALRGLTHVVMDEVHYLADRARGAVWEEVIIHLPEEVALVSLSATVSNAEEFGDWLGTVRGATEVVVEEHRPVPLWQHVLVGTRLYDLFVQDRGQAVPAEVNPELVRLAREEVRFAPRERGGRPAGLRRAVASRSDVLERLDREGLLPAITFVFSRAGCAAAVEQCLRAGLRLNTAEEAERVRLHVEKRTSTIPREDLTVLGYWEWLEALQRGIAAHHAGMLPTFKEVVEGLFHDGLVKAVFATETLALGINMPARSVVLEKLTKWNGETHADVTPGEYTQLTGRAGRGGHPGAGAGGGHRRPVVSRSEVLSRLDSQGLLPAITFIFSRAGCSAAVQQCVRSGLRLNTPEEAERVRRHVEKRTSSLPREDLQVLGYWEWLDALQRGFAAHHAGMLPTFKEVVEELFSEGLVQAVFATETLALGINMPARSVVLEKLTKWNGEAHADVTPGEYTQLTGRAGRRGIDVEGHAVVLWQPGLSPKAVAGLASTRTYPLRSSFRPSYNMAVNLVGSLGREQARTLLESSFAQFQADASVVGLARQIRRNLEGLEGYRTSMTCHLGDVAEYGRLRAELSRREADLSRRGAAQRRAAAAEALSLLQVGDVIRVPGGRRAGLAVVLDPGVSSSGEAHPLVLTEDRWAGRLSVADFPVAVEPAGRVRVPKHFEHRSPQARRDLASTLSSLDVPGTPRRGRRRAPAADDAEIAALRSALRRHPVHSCEEREAHLRWAERWQRLRSETDGLERRVAGKTSSIARTFDRVCAVLDDLGYLAGEEVTGAGQSLASVYSESDLLVVESLRRGLWDGLGPAELAAAVSTLAYQSRRPEESSPVVPAGGVQAALSEMDDLWADLREVETRAGVQFLRRPDPGFTWAVWRWAGGATLESVLGDDPDLTAGDFVRWCKQLLDLLGQVAVVVQEVSPQDGELRRTTRKAIEAVRRGVVAYSSVG